jgi:hypothetical protein
MSASCAQADLARAGNDSIRRQKCNKPSGQALKGNHCSDTVDFPWKEVRRSASEDERKKVIKEQP